MFRLSMSLVLFTFLSLGYAHSATQTNWSSGPGFTGPVTSWESGFLSCSGVSWSFQIGSLTIGNEEYLVTDTYGAAGSIFASDIDLDGDNDILSSKHWFENPGSGSSGNWVVHPLGNDWGYVITADIDTDGDQDAIIASEDSISWIENHDGLGTIWVEHSMGTLSRAIPPVCCDFDGDNDLDVACANFTSNDGIIFWWENLDGIGSDWVRHEINASSNGYYEIAVGDIDSDGDNDIAAACIYTGDVIWVDNADGTGTSWTTLMVDDDFDSSMHILICDIDSDGDSDIAGGGTGSDSFSWWENVNGAGTDWTKHQINSSASICTRLTSGDPDGDGDMDLSGSTGLDGLFIWLENENGSGTEWAERIICDLGTYTWTDCANLEDINGDGLVDLIGSVNYENCIFWWDILIDHGSLTSSILNTGDEPVWDQIQWTAILHAGTEVGFLVRASDDWEEMGSWSDTLWTPCSLTGILDDGNQYFQYKNILRTPYPDSTPVLMDVTVSWTQLGIEGFGGMEDALIGPEINPSSGIACIHFTLGSDAQVQFQVFDISGRMVEENQREYHRGYNSISLLFIQPGIYFCRMSAGEFTATKRFVVIQ